MMDAKTLLEQMVQGEELMTQSLDAKHAMTQRRGARCGGGRAAS